MSELNQMIDSLFLFIFVGYLSYTLGQFTAFIIMVFAAYITRLAVYFWVKRGGGE